MAKPATRISANEFLQDSSLRVLTGDVTGSGVTGIGTTITEKAVTPAKMADVATGTMLGRATAGTGSVEALEVTGVKTLLAYTPEDIGAEPANANIQSHIASTSNPHGVTAAQSGAVAANLAITGATKTKVTYDAKGLVTAGADATTADIADSADKRYVSDIQRGYIGKLDPVAGGTYNLNASIPSVTIIKNEAGATPVTINASAGTTIEGSATMLLTVQYESVTLTLTGTTWIRR